MKNFLLLDIRDIKKNIQYMDNPLWKLVKLSPYYSEMCTCYSRNCNYTFSELIHFFLEGSESERIGAISIISECYPDELYKFICDNVIPKNKMKYLFDVILPYNLPIVVPKDKMMDYNFDKEYLENIWVKIFLAVKSYMK